MKERTTGRLTLWQRSRTSLLASRSGRGLSSDSLDEALADPVSPGLVVVLANAAAGTSGKIANDVDRARAGSLAVLPIARSVTGVGSCLPESLRAINVLPWDDTAEGAQRIAALLGLVESERKLFLSYRRIEAEGLALQLRRQLTDRQFDVFLDRFSVPPGVDFQERLTQEARG